MNRKDRDRGETVSAQDWGKVASFGRAKAKKLSDSGSFAPDPLTWGSVPAPAGAKAIDLIISPRSALAIFSPKRKPLF